MAAISKFHIGSKIINADTQTDVGTILHDGSLKTVNGVSLVGSGDFSPLSVTQIGYTSSTSTFSHDMSQYKFILFEYEADPGAFVVDSVLHKYQTVSGYNHILRFELQSGYPMIEFSIASNSVSIDTNADNVYVYIYGVK